MMEEVPMRPEPGHPCTESLGSDRSISPTSEGRVSPSIDGSEAPRPHISGPSFTRLMVTIAAAFIGGALYTASTHSFVYADSGGPKQLRSRSGWFIESSTSSPRANEVTYDVQSQLVAPSMPSASGVNNSALAEVEGTLLGVVKRLEEVVVRAENAAQAAEAAEAASLGRQKAEAKARAQGPPKLSVCNDAFDVAEMAATSCRLITCDETSAQASRTPTYVGDACSTNTWIDRHPSPLPAAEKAANAEMGGQPNGFVFYPGLDPQERPNCPEWFFAEHGGFVGTVNTYLTRKVPTVGISRRVYYNAERMHEGRQPKVVYVYAAATVEDYQKEMSLFNLKQVKKTFGDDAFIILVEATAFEGLEVYKDDVDVILHTRVVASEVYYDDLLLQEGILEAYKIFGKDLIGIDMLVVINDSLMGPMDLKIYDKWKAVQGQAIISMSVWRNTITTGAGMVFTRKALQHKSFSSFWRYMRFPCGKWGSMALWEGTAHGYFTSNGASCMTSTNQIDEISWSDRWQDWKLPYYKHRNKHGDAAVSIYHKYQSRTADAQQPKSITLEDRDGQPDAGIEGRGLEGCDLGTRGGYVDN